ncbi:alkaline phosphatase D family protein [Membranihabitans maritimus]|uniref:alkaline phosphatase D family protein n=1 Tax=Membranihabitans maritimus TaxID=2904244 RepID=UPI001F1DEF5F|nr:alkaline phosphatase D family protein [Membranihabitans maritimus]
MNRIVLLIFLFVKIGVLSSQNFGDQEHPMNKLSSNISVLNYWEEQNPVLNTTYNLVSEILSKDEKSGYVDVVEDQGYNDWISDHNIEILGGPMLGDVKSDGVSIWVRTALPGEVTVTVENEDFTKSFPSVKTKPENDLSGIVKIDGLKPNEKYFYSLSINGKRIHPFQNYYFTTAPEENSEVRLAFGSCPHRWGLGNKALWSGIERRNPDAMFLLGDIAVQDRNGHLGEHRLDYLARDFQFPWAEFTSKIPVYASWDDHDYFDNDKSGIPDGYVQSDKEGVWEVFKNSWNNPTYGLGESSKGVFTRTRIGSVDILMTDNRYFRTGKEGDFLGDKQMEWLKKQLLDCRGPFIVVSCGTMWSDYVSNGKDSWGRYDPEGREGLLSFIENNNIKGVIFISGDRHGARGFTIPRKNGFQYYEFEAASLGGRVGPPARKDSWDTQLYGYDAVFAFGELTFNPDPSIPSVTYRLIKDNGTILYEKEILREELIPKNYSND